MSELVGRHYRALVNKLERRLEDIVAGLDVPRLLILEAPSGSGKSKIIRELYEQLRLHASFRSETPEGDCYWPSLEADVYVEDGINSGFQQRKQLGPDHLDFRRPAHATPGFMWQAIRCDVLAGKANGSLIEMLAPQVRAHAPFLAHAIHKNKNTRERSQSALKAIFSLDEWEKLRDASTGEAILKIFEHLQILQGVPFVAWGIDRGIEAYRLARANRARERMVAEGGTLEADLNAAETMYKALMAGVHRLIPLVVVVEDIHLIDDEVAALVAALAVPIKNRPVLIIGTAWPESANRDAYAALLASFENQGAAPSSSVEVISIEGKKPEFPRLSPLEKASFVSAYAPRTPRDRAIEVASMFENPFAIKLSMSSQYVQKNIHNQSLNLSKKDLARLPKTVEEIYRARWKELSAPVREALVSAAATFPASELASGELHFFMRDILIEAISAWKSLPRDKQSAESALDLALDPLHWLSQVDSDSVQDLQFKEWILQRVVYDELGETWTSAEIRDFRSKCISVLQEKILGSFKGNKPDAPKYFGDTDVRGRRAARYFLGLTNSADSEHYSHVAAEICHLSLGNAAISDGKTREAITHLKKVKFNSRTLKNDFMWGLKYDFDALVAELWPTQSVLDGLEGTLESLQRFYPGGTWLVSAYNNLIGITCLALRQPAKAISLFESLKTRVAIEFGKAHPYYQMTLLNLARTYYELEEFSKAKRSLSQLAEFLTEAIDLGSSWVGGYFNLNLKLNPSEAARNEYREFLKGNVESAQAKWGKGSTREIIARNDLLGSAAQFNKSKNLSPEWYELIDEAVMASDQEHEYFGEYLLKNLSIELEREFRQSADNRELREKFEAASEKAFAFVLQHQNKQTKAYAQGLQIRIDQLIALGRFKQARKLIDEEKAIVQSADDMGVSQRFHQAHEAFFLDAIAIAKNDLALAEQAYRAYESVYLSSKGASGFVKTVCLNLAECALRLGDETNYALWLKEALKNMSQEDDAAEYFQTVIRIVRVLDQGSKRREGKSLLLKVVLDAIPMVESNTTSVIEVLLQAAQILASWNEFRLAQNVGEELAFLSKTKSFSELSFSKQYEILSVLYDTAHSYGDIVSMREAADRQYRLSKSRLGQASKEQRYAARLRRHTTRLGLTTQENYREQSEKLFREIRNSIPDGVWLLEWARFLKAFSRGSSAEKATATLKLEPSPNLSPHDRDWFDFVKYSNAAAFRLMAGERLEALELYEEGLSLPALSPESRASLQIGKGLIIGQLGNIKAGREMISQASRSIVASNGRGSRNYWEAKIRLLDLALERDPNDANMERLVNLRSKLVQLFHRNSDLILITVLIEIGAEISRGNLKIAEKLLNNIRADFDPTLVMWSEIEKFEHMFNVLKQQVD
jgi:hypothetical protein